MLNISREESGAGVVLRCQGRIVRGEEIRVLCAAAKRQEGEVILDLSGVDSMDAAGIGALLSLQAAGIYVQLVNPTPHVRELLRMTKVDTVIDIGDPAAAVLPVAASDEEAFAIRP